MELFGSADVLIKNLQADLNGLLKNREDCKARLDASLLRRVLMEDFIRTGFWPREVLPFSEFEGTQVMIEEYFAWRRLYPKVFFTKDVQIGALAFRPVDSIAYFLGFTLANANHSFKSGNLDAFHHSNSPFNPQYTGRVFTEDEIQKIYTNPSTCLRYGVDPDDIVGFVRFY
jgi:hypothetical protein